jgi:pimeloyl-ACP methyl ester carboxylesterase
MPRKPSVALAAALLGCAVLLAAGALVYSPFETVAAIRKAQLWAGGVRRVRLDGGLFAYERDNCAPGRPCRCVALIHGMGDSGMTWDKLLLDARASEPGLRLVAPDMPGSEGSAIPSSPAGYAIRAQAGTLKEALAGLCPSWTVAGNSLGGWTSLWLALDWPAGVKDLILLDSAGITDPSGRAEASARVLADPTLEKLKEFSRRARFKDREIPERAWLSGLAAIRARHTSDVAHALRREELLDGRLRALKLPVRIIWGDADGIIPMEVGRRLHALIRGSRYESVQHCGHLPQQECPEAVAGALFGAAPR